MARVNSVSRYELAQVTIHFKVETMQMVSAVTRLFQRTATSSNLWEAPGTQPVPCKLTTSVTKVMNWLEEASSIDWYRYQSMSLKLDTGTRRCRNVN
jgi:hypothetical protein